MFRNKKMIISFSDSIITQTNILLDWHKQIRKTSNTIIMIGQKSFGRRDWSRNLVAPQLIAGKPGRGATTADDIFPRR
jgi:hypothetical protein